MEKLFNWLSVAVCIFGGWLANILGGFDLMLQTILYFIIIDYITGVIKAIYFKKISSEIGFKGILKKVLIFVIIALATILQSYTGDSFPIREIVIVFYIANEGISILENVSAILPVPTKLKSFLLQLRDKTEDESNDK